MVDKHSKILKVYNKSWGATAYWCLSTLSIKAKKEKRIICATKQTRSYVHAKLGRNLHARKN
jgi:hypothetical protein